MARKFLTALDLVQNELQNARVQNLGTAPTSPTPVKGQMYFNSTDNTLYWYDGSAWIAARSGAPTLGAVTAEPTFGSASADGVASSVSRSDHRHGNPVHDAAAHSAIPLSALAVPTATIDMGSYRIINLLTPSANNDAANKLYVDQVAQGLDAKMSVKCATTANITLTGLATVDGVSTTVNDRVLVKNQTSAPANGIYLAQSGAWTRAADADTWGELVSAFVFVEEGTTQKDTGWVCTSDAVGGVIGVTDVVWTQFSGAGTYTAGAGLTQSGNTFDVVAANGSIVVGADNVQVGYGGTGAAATSARSDHTHDATYALRTTAINTTPPLSGGGDLTATRTLAISGFTSAFAGTVPASGGGTVNFLRADGNWMPAGTVKYNANVPASATAVINHVLNTKDLQVQVWRVAAPYDTIECDVERTDNNNVTLRFAVAPALNEYRCTVIG